MKRTPKLAAALLAFGALAGLARAALWIPAPMTEEAVPAAASPPLSKNTPFTLFYWNIQFAGSRDFHFFYDGGPAVRVPEAVVDRTLERLDSVIHQENPDILLLTEADRGSARTALRDTFAALTGRYTQAVSSPYHRVRYLPYPAHAHLGRVEMHQGLASQFLLLRATRYQLPLLKESWIRQQFNLRRALLDTRVAREGGEIAVLLTHLSAFSKGDGTLSAQVEQLLAHLQLLDTQGIPWVLVGDFNALPPGDDAARLGAGAVDYPESDTPIAPLYARYTAVPPLSEATRPEWRTYQPFGAPAPDRTLDYAFVSDQIEVLRARVVQEGAPWSDHLPLAITLRIRETR